MNTTLFAWPQNIEVILDLSFARLTARRERAEEELKARCVEFEETLNELSKDIEVFRRKEVSESESVGTSTRIQRHSVPLKAR